MVRRFSFQVLSPLIVFLDRVSERVYNYIKEVRRKGR